ncbi:MAG: hypothetical protein ABI748_13515, partial [Dokdonella sp.]
MPEAYAHLLAALSTSAYWQGTGVVFVLMAAVYFVNASARTRLDAALGEGLQRKPLRMFDLSHGSTQTALQHRHLVVPERLWTYDEEYLERFARVAGECIVRGEGSVLRFYVSAILRRWDCVFAILLAIVVTMIDFGIAKSIVSNYPSWACVAMLAGCMGVLYGVADAAEDFKLASILRKPETIDAGEAAAANFLTRAKFVTITASGFGIAI